MGPIERSHTPDTPLPSGASAARNETRQRTKRELRLAVDKTAIERLRTSGSLVDHAKGQPSTRHLTSTYYETNDGRLARRGLSLYVRTDGHHFTQAVAFRGTSTATSTAGLRQREKWETDIESPTPQLQAVTDPELRDHLGLLRPGALQELFVVEVDREERIVEIREGGHTGLIAVALDVGQIRAGLVVAPVAELTLELLRGSTATLCGLALDLLDHVPMALEGRSQAERGFALIDGKPPPWEKAAPLELQSTMSVEDAMAAVFRDCMIHWTANQAAALDGTDPEGVHQLRVGLRRFRSALTTFGPLLSVDALEWLKTEARWAIQALNPARDWDVFITEMLPPVAKANGEAAFADLGRAARLEQKRGYEHAGAMLRSSGYTRFILELKLWLEQRGWQRDASADAMARFIEPIAEFASALLTKRHEAALKRGKRFDEQTAEQRHRVRIALKKLRYAVEFFRTLFSDEHATAYLKRLKSLQDDLGHLNDVATAERLLHDALDRKCGEDPSRLALAAGQILGWYAHHVETLEPQARRDWQKFSKAETFW